MLNHLAEQEIATELGLCETFCVGDETPDLDAEAFVVAGELGEDEWNGLSAALLQCYLLLQFLRFLWE